MPDPRYAFISAYLKGEESKVATSDQINRMSAASDVQDALAMIRETDVGGYLEELPIKTFDDVDEWLWKYFAQCIRDVESFRFVPKDISKVSRAYIVKYDVSNIKAALQGISTGKKTRMIPVGIICNGGLLDELFNAGKLEDIIGLLIKCELGDYASVLKEYKTDGGARSKLLVEAKLDGEYYKNLLSMTKGIKDGSVLSKAFGLAIDLTNLQIVARAIIEGIGTDAADCTIAGGYLITEGSIRDLLSFKLIDVPQRLENAQYRDIASEVSSSYDKTKSVTAIEEVIDKHKFMLLRDVLSPRILSPLVMAWHLILKEVEIRNLRLVLKMIADGIALEEIKEYLVGA
ncbi:MAG: V-type ATPase subunit [Dehalococcoidia bacterium]|nr:V-type ATPase subunit [Dehalococcoidia bacterium]